MLPVRSLTWSGVTRAKLTHIGYISINRVAVETATNIYVAWKLKPDYMHSICREILQ